MKKLVTIILASIGALSLLIALNGQMRRAAAAELALNEGTLSAVAEASGELSRLTLTLEKLLVSTSAAHQAELLSTAALSADRVQRSLSDLPDLHDRRGAIMAELSALGEAAAQSLADLAEGDFTLDSAEFGAFLAKLRLLHGEITLAQRDLHQGNRLDDALPESDVTRKPTALELSTYRALPSSEVNRGTAMRLAKEFVGLDRVTSVAPAPDTLGALPCYGVTVQTADVQLNLEVTRRGGKVLLMAPETASFSIRKTPEQCAQSALSFLQAQEFPAMEAVYFQVYDGICVITCCYQEQGVLVWGDRVLVQIRMDTGEVVGIEARHFWQNHTPRRNLTPLLTADEAAASLTRDAQIEGTRLALLPHDGGERLCWQFTIVHGGERFSAWIDAFTGVELRLDKIVQLDFGTDLA